MSAEAKRVRRAWLRALEGVAALERRPGLTLAGLVEEAAGLHGDRLALVGPSGGLSYGALGRRVAAVAAWGARHRGQVVGLLARNSVDYVPVWLGLTRAGSTVALLNHHLRGAALRHAIQSGGCAVVLAESALAGLVDGVAVVTLEALAGLPSAGPSGFGAAAEVMGASGVSARGAETVEPALLIYTSGTSGLPKAVRVTHRRVMEWSLWFAGLLGLEPEDRIYDALPLYHSTGGVVAVGAAFAAGASVWIADEFSVRRFWDEVVEAECTVFFYIGELCRYLVGAAAHPRERAHRLRVACGNGLAGDVWERFEARFGVPQVLEFYAATEGSLSLYNVEGRRGAIGRVPPFVAARPLALVRVDLETREPLRGADGLCLACAPGEVGEALGRRPFDGYTDEAASAAKVLRDVVVAGDRWFRTGDLMREDADGFVYFVDRLGDSFRWKGENVSAAEVAGCLRACPGVADAVAYGVRVPGHEGRAGMAAVVPGADFALDRLWAHAAAALPSYAQPVFVRLCPALASTGTFKPQVAALVAEGYGGGGAVWFNDRSRRAYVRMEAGLEAAIEDGSLRV